jgi:Zinc knuckle
VGKPNTLDKLRTLAQTINARYWECRSEVARETSGGKTQEQQNDKGKSPATTTQEQKTPSSGTSGPSGSSSTTTSTPKSTSDLSSKLGKNGTLTPQERQHRFNQNLCLFCGKTGHVAKDCPKSTAAKARATNAMENSNSKATVRESKN